MRNERGEATLIGLMMAASLSVLVMGASLNLFDRFQTQTDRDSRRADLVDQARRGSDRIARALRNLASPVPEQPEAVDRATATDLVFKTVDDAGPNTGQNTANVRRVRYCLAASGVLWQQVQTWTSAAPPAMPSVAACPAASGWSSTTQLAGGVTNTTVANGPALFSYDATALPDITRIGVELWIADPAGRVQPTMLRTGVFLRNQNRRPIAGFSATRTAQGILLNGSASYDPEGDPLVYAWYDGATYVGAGVALTYKVVPGSTHPLSLQVQDPAGLSGTAATQQVVG